MHKSLTIVGEFHAPNDYLQKEFENIILGNSYISDLFKQSSSNGYWYWNIDTLEESWISPSFWSSLGYGTDEIPHTSRFWQNIVFHDDIQIIKDLIQSAKENTENFSEAVIRYYHRLGHIVYLRCRAIGIKNDNNEVARFLCIHDDITKLKKVEFELKKQIDKYKHIIETTNLGTWEWNLSTSEIRFNEQWADTVGYTLIELEPVSVNTWIRGIHSDDQTLFNLALTNHIEGKSSFFECEIRQKHENGYWIWLLVKGQVISRLPNGEAEWLVGSNQEITKTKKQIETQLTFIRNAPSAIAMFDTEMKYLAYSKKWKADYNIKKDDIIGISHYDIFPEIGEVWKSQHLQCLSGEVLTCDEDCFERLDGSKQWISWELHPWYTSNGSVGGIIMLTNDITRTKEAELELKFSEKKFRESFENAAIGMAIVSLKGNWLEVNNTMTEMFGYSKEEFLGYNFNDITYPEDIDKGNELVKELLNNKANFFHHEKRYIHKNGSTIYAKLSVSIIKDELKQPVHFIVHITDITSKVIANRKVQKTLSQLESILESSTQVSIIGTDCDGVITTFNTGAENLLGYKKDELIYKETPAIIHDVDEVIQRGTELSEEFNESIQGFEVFVAYANRGKFETREWTYIRKDGTRFPVQLTVTAIKEDHKIVGYLGVAAGITEIKKVEKEITELLDVTGNQNNRLKNFAHIVSHNLRSHSGNFNMLLDFFAMDNPDFENSEIAVLFKNASDNLAETIEHLNEVVLMNTNENQNLIRLPLKQYIDKTIDGISAIARKHQVHIENLVSPDASIYGITAYIDSIILNFLTNGIKYRSDNRNSYVVFNAYQDQDYLVLTVEDNGLGIDLDRHHPKLFGMYKTFHNNEDARGIGLFITKNQIEAMGGKIEVESKVDIGTIFKIYLRNEKN